MFIECFEPNPILNFQRVHTGEAKSISIVFYESYL